MTTWSYSSLSTFKQCPKKYYHLRIIKDVKDQGSTATVYGQEVHKVAEEFIRDKVQVPKKYAFINGVLDALNKIEGEKLCELKLGVAKTEDGYEPVDFFADNVWWRGIADLVIINGDTAHSIDYKTSKNAKYADTKQLDAVAAGLFTHFPELKKIKSALAFVVSKEFIQKEHVVEKKEEYFGAFEPDLERLEVAQESGVWNAISGPLCGWCPVTSCEHHRKR
jgi:ATP-dependent helicase/DNAse subunit B